MINWVRKLVGFVLVGLVSSGYAKDDPNVDSDAIESDASMIVEVFTPPVPKERKGLRYPIRQQNKGKEGWVLLNFMVDPQGKPYDVSVFDSSDEQDFEKEAIRAVRKWTYEPAVLQGQPIDAGSQAFIKFGFEGVPGAGRYFVLRYKRLQKYIAAGRLDEAATIFEDLRSIDRNLYEEAFFHLARYSYQLALGGGDRQLYDSLKRATAMDNNAGFLPDALLTNVLISKLQLELRLNELVFAVYTVKVLRARELEDDLREFVDGVQAQIVEFRKAGKSFVTQGIVRVGNRSAHGLLYNQFSFRDVEGDIAELRLHCRRGYVGFIYQSDISYKVEDDLRSCTLHLIGTPGTTYSLVQGSS